MIFLWFIFLNFEKTSQTILTQPFAMKTNLATNFPKSLRFANFLNLIWKNLLSLNEPFKLNENASVVDSESLMFQKWRGKGRGKGGLFSDVCYIRFERCSCTNTFKFNESTCTTLAMLDFRIQDFRYRKAVALEMTKLFVPFTWKLSVIFTKSYAILLFNRSCFFSENIILELLKFPLKFDKFA